MMTDNELEVLLTGGETDRVERKRDTSNMDAVRRTVCAFANDMPNHRLPGVIFIGVEDDGSPSRLLIDDQLLRTLSDIATDGNILPLPHMTVQNKILLGCPTAVIEVFPANSPPVRYKGTVWIRTASRCAIASQQQESMLTEKRRFRDAPFDLQPVTSAELKDIDADLFTTVYLPQAVSRETLAENHRTLQEQLVALRLAAEVPSPPGGGSAHPTVCGLLAVGRNPTDFIPGAYIQFLRLNGPAITDTILDSRELRGPLPGLLRSLDELLKINIRTAVDFTSSDQEIRRPDYPIVALQQITRNAVMHRSYDSTHAPVRIHWFVDRVEIQSPGGPFGRVTRENFGRPSANDYRNSGLAEAMKTLGYVQRFGFGIAQARNEMEKNGNPPLEFQIEESHIGAILRKQP